MLGLLTAFIFYHFDAQWGWWVGLAIMELCAVVKELNR